MVMNNRISPQHIQRVSPISPATNQIVSIQSRKFFSVTQDECLKPPCLFLIRGKTGQLQADMFFSNHWYSKTHPGFKIKRRDIFGWILFCSDSSQSEPKKKSKKNLPEMMFLLGAFQILLQSFGWIPVCFAWIPGCFAWIPGHTTQCILEKDWNFISQPLKVPGSKFRTKIAMGYSRIGAYTLDYPTSK